MLYGLLILVGCQLAGEIVIHFSGLSIPPAVMGMIILFVGLIIKGGIPENLDKTASGIVKHISVLFIAPGAGISLYLGLLYDQWLVIALASVTSTVLTLLVCGSIFQLLGKGGSEE